MVSREDDRRYGGSSPQYNELVVEGISSKVKEKVDDAVDRNLRSLRDTIDNVKTSLENVKSEVSSSINELKSEVRSSLMDVSTKTDEKMRTACEGVECLKKEFSSFSTKVDTIGSETKTLKERVIPEITKKIDVMKAESEKNVSQLSDMIGKKIESVRNEYNERLEKFMKSSDAKVNELKTTLDELKKSGVLAPEGYKKLCDGIDCIKDELKTGFEKINEITNKQGELESAVKTGFEKVAEITNKQKELESTVKTISDSVNKIVGDVKVVKDHPLLNAKAECPNCKKSSLRLLEKSCPECGSEVVWE